VTEIGTEGVTFAGRVSREERDGLYRQASVYISTSVHEGFCAPLVEAMAHGIPVVARAAGAVPETLGEAGIVLDTQDASVFADALHEAVTSPETRASIVAAGARRLGELQPENVGRRLRAALEPLVERL
jgi:glycosyltransferase involved in cell wall biosynthesis